MLVTYGVSDFCECDLQALLGGRMCVLCEGCEGDIREGGTFFMVVRVTFVSIVRVMYECVTFVTFLRMMHWQA